MNSPGFSLIQQKKDKYLFFSSLLMLPVVISLLFITYFLVPPEKSNAPLVCMIIPQALAATLLMYLFDCRLRIKLRNDLTNILKLDVPHRPHIIPYKEDPFRSTNATSFLNSLDGVLWTSVTLSQNLHIIHHIWPFMPFCKLI